MLQRLAKAIRPTVGIPVPSYAVGMVILVSLLPVWPAGDTRQLVLGQSFELDLRPGQSSPYRIGQRARKYVRVDLHGIDVVRDLVAPDGTKFSEIDGPDGAEGPESASVFADCPGDYRVEVRASVMDAPAEVIASPWDADDASTAELIKRFHCAMIPATATLRYIQLNVSHEKRWAQPYSWAGFVLQGDSK